MNSTNKFAVEASMLSARSQQENVDAPGAYKAAQARLNQHLSELKATGKSAEATELQAQIAGSETSLGTSGQLDAATESGAQAYRSQNFGDAEKSYKEAVRLAETVHPHDQRLVMSLGFLGSLYHSRKDDADAGRSFQQQLEAAQEVWRGFTEGRPRL